LENEIKGSKFHDVDIIRDRTSINLECVWSFQKPYPEGVCMALEGQFKDNDTILSSKILHPSKMHLKRMGLAS
jgi:hypothetical protein